MQREMTVAGWRRAWIAQARDQSFNGAAVPKAHCPQGQAGGRETVVGGSRKTQFGQGQTCRVTGVRGMGEERSGARGHAVSQRGVGTALQSGASGACSRRWRTGAYGVCGQVAAVRQLRRIGEGKVRVAGQLQPKRGTAAKQVCRSAR